MHPLCDAARLCEQPPERNIGIKFWDQLEGCAPRGPHHLEAVPPQIICPQS